MLLNNSGLGWVQCPQMLGTPKNISDFRRGIQEKNDPASIVKE